MTDNTVNIEVREMTSAELDEVSGGITPVAIAGWFAAGMLAKLADEAGVFDAWHNPL
jgi:lactobin A/cerein 7B family class IIb bacteriocin